MFEQPLGPGLEQLQGTLMEPAGTCRERTKVGNRCGLNDCMYHAVSHTRPFHHSSLFSMPRYSLPKSNSQHFQQVGRHSHPRFIPHNNRKTEIMEVVPVLTVFYLVSRSCRSSGALFCTKCSQPFTIGFGPRLLLLHARGPKRHQYCPSTQAPVSPCSIQQVLMQYTYGFAMQ